MTVTARRLCACLTRSSLHGIISVEQIPTVLSQREVFMLKILVGTAKCGSPKGLYHLTLGSAGERTFSLLFLTVLIFAHPGLYSCD